MKRSKGIAVLALFLGIFFLFQFAGELFFALGKERLGENGVALMRSGMAFSPLASRYFREAGLRLLEAGGAGKGNREALERSVGYFLAALKKNPLDYQSRYYLAKAYLGLATDSSEFFDKAVAELTRASRLRGGNKQIALDCGRIFFSIWPLLEQPDKEFASTLLAGAMPEFSWPEFSPLLEMWSLYVRDTSLLMVLLNRKPDFFAPAANQLVSAGIPIEKRLELLDLHEIHTLEALEGRFNELSLQGLISQKHAQSLLAQTLSIKGYHRLQDKSSFDQGKLAKLRRLLLLEVIGGMLADPKKQADPKSRQQVNNLILTFIRKHGQLRELDELQKVLEEENFFKGNDFSSLYFKTLIAYKKGNYGDIIAEIETLRKGISFVKKEQLTDYTAILLLLVDSYYASKLMTSAEGVASELYQNQPDNPDIHFRLLQIENILGREETTDKALEEKMTKVNDSRLLILERAAGSYVVYLLEKPEIEITIAAGLLQQLKSTRRLLQVFVGDEIAFEGYSDALPEKIVIGPPFTAPEQKVTLRIALQ